MATLERRLAEVLSRAQSLQLRGENITAEEMCRDCPDLLDEVRQRLQAAPLTGHATDTRDSMDILDPAQKDDNLRAGYEVIPGYTLIQRVGRGGYGEVWKASAPGGFAVALKFVSLDAEFLHIEERSLEIIKTLRHPNLLTTVGSWRTDQYLVIGMELADGTLRDRYHEAVAEGNSGIPRDELLQYLQEAARGIDFLNGQQLQLDGSERSGVQHRDIKPENILIAGNGVKIADFGLARLLEGAETGHTGNLTHLTAAPEFFKGMTSQQSDQYSLAITYCQLRAGSAPFTGSPAEVMYGHLTQSPELLMLPPEERPVVARALSKTPTDRWPNCIAFVDALRDCVPQQQSTVRVVRSPHPSMRRAISLAGLCLAALCPLLFIALYVGAGGFLQVESVKQMSSTQESSNSRQQEAPSKGAMSKPASDRAAAASGETAIISKSVNMKLVLIPAGAFIMGSAANETGRQRDEGPQHTVVISQPFYLGASEVTQDQYTEVMVANPSYFSASGPGSGNSMRGQETGSHPVEEVSWFDAIHFCNRLSEADGRKPRYHITQIEQIGDSIHSANVELLSGTGYRLPTEVEWEYACRANTTTPFYFGSVLNGEQSNIDGNEPYGTRTKGPFLARTAKVGSYWKNDYGLYDMHGNVMEWCWETYDEDAYTQCFDLPTTLAKASEPAANSPAGNTSESEHRVLKGGCWNESAANARCARRVGISPSTRYYTIGFRIAADAVESTLP